MSVPLYTHTLKSFGIKINSHPRSVRRLVDSGDIRVVRFGSKKKPTLRLESPEEYLARAGRYSGPEPEPAIDPNNSECSISSPRQKSRELKPQPAAGCLPEAEPADRELAAAE